MSHPVIIFYDMDTSSFTSPAKTPVDARAHTSVVQQPVLPYDDERDAPISYALTPAAQQLLVPGSRPALTAVPSLDDDDQRDPRRAQVKAMYRGGVAPQTIAAQLEIDLLLVRGWLELGPLVARTPVVATLDTAENQRVSAADRYRAAEQFAHDPQFAFAVGVLSATAEIEPASVTLTFTDTALAATVLTLLRVQTPIADAQLHVVLRLARRSHGDVVRSRWAQVLGCDATQIRTVRSRNDGVDEVMLRVVDTHVAALCELWCAAALNPVPTAVDVAF